MSARSLRPLAAVVVAVAVFLAGVDCTCLSVARADASPAAAAHDCCPSRAGNDADSPGHPNHPANPSGSHANCSHCGSQIAAQPSGAAEAVNSVAGTWSALAAFERTHELVAPTALLLAPHCESPPAPPSTLVDSFTSLII